VQRVVLARHAESVFNARGTVNGDPSIPGPLTPTGVEQARALGIVLAQTPFDLCVTTEFERVIQTADEALRGREVPRVVMPGLDDPRLGPFEGAPLVDYRDWARTAPSSESPGGDGESRVDIIERYTRSYRELLDRPEESIIVVAHSLPIAYVLFALDGNAPASRVPLVANASAHPLEAAELETAVEALEGWLAAPSF
jgi:broad specificity phosphatase PhoE